MTSLAPESPLTKPRLLYILWEVLAKDQEPASLQEVEFDSVKSEIVKTLKSRNTEPYVKFPIVISQSHDILSIDVNGLWSIKRSGRSYDEPQDLSLDDLLLNFAYLTDTKLRDSVISFGDVLAQRVANQKYLAIERPRLFSGFIESMEETLDLLKNNQPNH